MRTSKSKSTSACRNSALGCSIMSIFITPEGSTRHYNIKRRMTFIFLLAIGKLWDIVNQRSLHQSFNNWSKLVKMKYTVFIFFTVLSILCEASTLSNSMQQNLRGLLEKSYPPSSFTLSVDEFPPEKGTAEKVLRIRIDFNNSSGKVCDLSFLTSLPKKYRYNITVSGEHLSFPNMKDLPIISLSFTNRNILSAMHLPKILKGLIILFSNKAEVKLTQILPPPPDLSTLCILFEKSADLELEELKDFKSIKVLLIGQRHRYQNSPYKIHLIPPQDNLYFVNLKKIIIYGTVDNIESLLQTASHYRLSIFYGTIDAKQLFNSRARIKEVLLSGCQIKNPEYLKKIPNVTVVPPSKKVPVFSEQLDSRQPEKQPQNKYRGFPSR